MRKLIAVTIALLMAAAMLSTGALADNENEHKGGREHRQSQGTRGNDDEGNSHRPANVPVGHTSDKASSDGTRFADDNENGNEDSDDNDNSNEDGDADDNDKGSVEEDDDDNGLMKTTAGEVKKENKESNHDEKPQEGPNHGNAYGRVRNTQEVLDSIGLMAGEETAVQLNTLMTAYREAKDQETAKAALTALLDALTLSCTVAATDENGDVTDGQEQLILTNMEKLREKVLANAGNDNGTLLALMHAYEDALRIMNHLEPIDDVDDGTETGDQAPATGTVAVPGI